MPSVCIDVHCVPWLCGWGRLGLRGRTDNCWALAVPVHSISRNAQGQECAAYHRNVKHEEHSRRRADLLRVLERERDADHADPR